MQRTLTADVVMQETQGKSSNVENKDLDRPEAQK
jgi:hypothetical protein